MQETPDLSDRNVICRQTLTRSRYHYRPISSSEFILTLVLTVFVGVGIFVASIANDGQNDSASQAQLVTEKLDRE